MSIKIFFILTIFFTNISIAFSYDAFKANQLIINKLINVKETLAKNNPSWSGVNLRLADLFAEQSRLCISKNCKTNQVLLFRKQATNLYKEILPSLSIHLKLRVYSQLGHLLQLSNQKAMAIKFYKKGLALKGDKLSLLAIKMSLAQVYFKIGNYKKAIVYYDQVLDEPNFNKQDLAKHKKSWALFRLNQTVRATNTLEDLIKKLHKEKSSGLVKVDTYFYSELLKDLVLFYSYKKSRPLVKAKKLIVWSSKKDQVKYLIFFAQELERLGHLPASLAVWNFNLNYLSNKKDRILAYQHITQSYYKSFLFAQATKSFASLIKECKKNISECKAYEVNLKNLLIDWLAIKKSKELLLQNCQQFISAFPNNGEVLVLSAQLARSLKKWEIALNLYKNIVTALQNKTLVFNNKKLLSLTVEHFLWSQVEVAELSQDTKLLAPAYKYFITNSKNKDKVFKIQYQSFFMEYENKKYKNIIQKFSIIVKDYHIFKTTSTQISSYKPTESFVKSANLILQTLVKLNQDKKIEEWIAYYQGYSFAKTKSWRAYKVQAILNQVAQLSQTGANQLAYSKLIDISGLHLSQKETISYYYNQLALLEKLNDKTQEEKVINKLLGFKKTIEAKKYEQLVLRKIWLSELKLDFGTAFTFLNKITNKKSSADRYLRLILFGKLSGKTFSLTSKYYIYFFQKEKNAHKKQALAVSLIEDNNFSLIAFNKYKKYLLKEQFQKISLIILNDRSFKAKQLDLVFLQKLLIAKEYKEGSNFLFLSRFYHLKKSYMPWLKLITQHKIKTRSQRQISRGLKKRLYLIKKGEKLLQQVVKRKDPILQMVYSKALATESGRLYAKILGLPRPKDLSKEESDLYTQVLEEKANVYKVKEEYYQKHYAQFWKNPLLISSLEEKIKNKTTNHFLLKLFVIQLKEVSPEATLPKLASLTELLEKNLNTRKISNVFKKQDISRKLVDLRNKVKDFPNKLEHLKNLIQEERKVKNKPMVAYLKHRLSSLNDQTLKGKN